MKRDVDASTLWFTAAELGNLMREYGDVAAQGGGLDWGIAKLDKTMIPSRAGQLNFIIARPGNGKQLSQQFGRSGLLRESCNTKPKTKSV